MKEIVIALIGFASGVIAAWITGYWNKKTTQKQIDAQEKQAQMTSQSAQTLALVSAQTQLLLAREPSLREHRTQQVHTFREKANVRLQSYHDLVSAMRASDSARVEGIIKRIASEADGIARELSHLTVTDPVFRSAARDLLKEESSLLGRIEKEAEKEAADQHQTQELTPEVLSRLTSIVEDGTNRVMHRVVALSKAADEYIYGVANETRQLKQLLPREEGIPRKVTQTYREEGEHVRRFRAQLSIDLPESWLAKDSLTILAPDGQANVIASSEPIAENMDTEEYVEQVGGALKVGFTTYRELALESMEVFGDRQGYIRHFETIHENQLPITQIQQYYCGNGRAYIATATTYSSEFERYAPQLRQLLGDLRLEET